MHKRRLLHALIHRGFASRRDSIFALWGKRRDKSPLKDRRRRAQEARQRVFIAPKGSGTGSPRRNATAPRQRAGVDSESQTG